MKRFSHSTPRVLAACFFSIDALCFSTRIALATPRGYPVLARHKNIAPPDAKTLALPPGNVAVAKNAPRELNLDLDGDGKIETVKIDPRRDPIIAVYRGKKLIARGAPRSWHAWKMTTGDVDGDGFREIVLGVNKVTNSLPFLHNCPFVLGFDASRIYRKWLGSSLANPFDDFLLADVDGDDRDELIALETLPNAHRSVAVYSWDSFGFAFDFRRGDWKNARLIRVGRGRVLARAEGKEISIFVPHHNMLQHKKKR